MTHPNRTLSQYEIVFGDSEEDCGFAELWDRSLAPNGLAFELVVRESGNVTLIGHGIHVPVEEVEKFLAEARAYFSIRP